jgi:hypothetical protein
VDRLLDPQELYGFSAGHTARRSQGNLALGLPRVSQRKCLTLKGPEVCRSAPRPVGSQFRPYLTAPSELILVGGLTQGKPWAMLYWPLRAMDLALSPGVLQTVERNYVDL